MRRVRKARSIRETISLFSCTSQEQAAAVHTNTSAGAAARGGAAAAGEGQQRSPLEAVLSRYFTNDELVVFSVCPKELPYAFAPFEPRQTLSWHPE
jgi:hypothetical protein